MAFWVCYSKTPPTDHTRHTAIYLDHQFYQLIFTHCRANNGSYRVLHEMAWLKYKSPVMVISGERLLSLNQDLANLAALKVSHSQIALFQGVCDKAISDGCALTISGDMYPELWKVPCIRVQVTFLPTAAGGRYSLPSPTSLGYMPHLVCEGSSDYLGVQFIGGAQPKFGVPGEFVVALMYSQVDYSALVPGAAFTVREGKRVVATGRVLGAAWVPSPQ